MRWRCTPWKTGVCSHDRKPTPAIRPTRARPRRARLHRHEPRAAARARRPHRPGFRARCQHARRARLGRRRARRGGRDVARHAGRGAPRRRHRVLPRAFHERGQGVRQARSPRGAEFRQGCGRSRRALHRLSRRTLSRGLGQRAPAVTKRDGRRTAQWTGARDRTARRHHRGPGLGRLRGHARPGAEPAGHGDAALGSPEIAAHSTRQPARVPRPSA